MSKEKIKRKRLTADKADVPVKRTPNTELPGILEINHDEGVVYFHLVDSSDVTAQNAITYLRISGLPTPIPKRRFDITLKGIAADDLLNVTDY